MNKETLKNEPQFNTESNLDIAEKIKEDIDGEFADEVLRNLGIPTELLDVDFDSVVEDTKKSAKGKTRRIKSVADKRQDEIDEELIDEFLMTTDDNEVFGRVWKRYYYGVRGFAYKIVKDWEEADDMACQTLTKAWMKKDLFDKKKAKFCTWLYRICRNICLGNMVANGRAKVMGTDISDIYESSLLTHCSSNDIEKNQYVLGDEGLSAMNICDLRDSIINASTAEIRNIGGIMEKIFNMKVNDGMKLRDIADALDMNISTVKNNYYGMKKILHDKMFEKHADLCQMYMESVQAEEDEMFGF